MSTSNVLPPGSPAFFCSYMRNRMKHLISPPLSTLCLVVGNTFCATVNAVARARRTVLAFVFCMAALAVGALCPAAYAQTGQWDWVAPSNPTGNTYSFGTVGVADQANYPPGRWSTSSWTDSSGKFWMFGGGISTLFTNDLWEYDPSTGLWTCMSGAWAYDSNYGTLRPLPASFGTMYVPATSNLPPARVGAATWTDSGGKLWLFGGSSNSTTGYEYNDLWVFDPSTKYWTWMGGGQTYRQQGVYGTLGTSNANNIPSSRQRPAVWTDSSGNVWLYGGFGQGYTAAGAATQGYLNDLWELNTTTLQWTWMGGSNVVNKVGTFGAQGSATAGSTPGGLAYTAYWTDSGGNFWLFGGAGYAKTSGGYAQDDLWEYSPATNQWTWVYGDGAPSKATVYGSMDVESSTNHLGGRSYSSGWSDGAGNFWLFGGYGTGTTTTLAPRDDIWRFNPSTGYWTWMAGTQTSYSPTVYNTQGVANAANDPGARGDEVTWVDNSGNIWLYGGSPNPYSPTTGGYLSDLWQYQFSTAAAQPVFNPNGGTNPITQTISITSFTPNATIYYTIDGSTPTVHSTLYTGPITGSQPEETIKAIAVASGYSHSPVASATFYWPLAAAPVISPVSGSYPAPLSVSITDTASGATIYYTTDGSTPTTSSAVYLSPISVNPPATVNAIATATDYNTSAVATATYIRPMVDTPVISPTSGSYPTPLSSISITDTTPGATIYYTTDGSTPTTSSPVYYGSFSIAYSATIQAIAAESGYTTSGTAKAVYTVIQPTPAISTVSPLTFTPNSVFTITVNGSNFLPTSVVYWGNTPLTTQYVSSTQLTAQVPVSLTNVDPSVTNPLGLIVKTPDAVSASNKAAIAAVSANSASVPITVSPATATVTAGSSTTFNVSFGGGASLSYVSVAILPTGATQQWIPDPYSTSSDTMTIATTSATPKGTYTLLVIGYGAVPVTSSAGFLLPPLLLPLLLWRKRLASKSVWLTLSVGFVLLLSALSFIGCGTGPKYQFTTTNTTTVVNATTVTLTVQ